MMDYADHIKLNGDFQKSINLELDLNNEGKINEYIPTVDICAIIKRFIRSCLGYNKDNAVNFVGPYGKGKSFLLLILSHLISRNRMGETHRNLLKKIKATDSELYDLISELDERELKLLPVIVNSNYSNLDQAFLLAMNEALQRENINDLIPETVYSVCLNIIAKWKDDENAWKDIEHFCKSELKITSKELVVQLKDNSMEGYENFRLLYRYVTKGVEFNPLINNDIIRIYNNVNTKLRNKGYHGMFIIFDEFSKFLDSQSATMGQDMKMVQDFAELANRSSYDVQMHFWVITHKSLNLYKNLDTNLFKTVEGRFTEIRFIESISENYEIISNAIYHETGWTYPEQFVQNHRNFFEQLSEHAVYRKIADSRNLFKGVFPLNPMTVLCLIQLCEKIAQNERTLFTFISDSNENSFSSFLQTHEDGLFNVDKIYDYFSSTMANDEDKEIKKVNYQACALLENTSDEDEKKIIKSLAVILAINDFNVVAPSAEDLYLSTFIPFETVQAKIEDLIDRHYLRKNVVNNLLSFASANSEEIDEKVEMESQQRKNSFSIADQLDEINEIRYLLPRKYNEQNKISRFFKVLYMSEDTFRELSSFDILFENRICDGIVINLLREKMTADQIIEKTKLVDDAKVIVCCPNEPIKSYLSDLALKYASLSAIIAKGGNDKVLVSEMEQILDEYYQDITDLTEDYFGQNCFYVYRGRSYSTAAQILSEAMSSVYTKKIIFNNELVNKTNVTKQYQKAVNNVVEWMLNGKGDFNYSATSPEQTIRSSVIDAIDGQDDVLEVVHSIKENISAQENSKLKVKDLVNTYIQPPYGIRRGIMPLLIADAISELSDNVIFYLKGKEIDLTASNIVKAVDTDLDYSFSFAKGSNEQTAYIENMLTCFKVEPTGVFRNDVKELCEEYRKFFVGMPMLIRSAQEGCDLQIDWGIIRYKNNFMSFNLNPYSVVCEKSLKAFETDSYAEIYHKLSEFVTSWKEILLEYKKKAVEAVKSAMHIDEETSIRMGIESFVKGQIPDNMKLELNDADAAMLDTVSKLSFEDTEAVNTIAKIMTGSYIEDWGEDHIEDLSDSLKAFHNDIVHAERKEYKSLEDIVNETAKRENSAIGNVMYDNIRTMFDEYGDSVSRDEKITILSKLLKEMI